VRPQKRGSGLEWGMSEFMEKGMAILEAAYKAGQGVTTMTALEGFTKELTDKIGQMAIEELSKEQAAQLFPPRGSVSDLRNPTEKP
jgi:hypothetical protein